MKFPVHYGIAILFAFHPLITRGQDPGREYVHTSKAAEQISDRLNYLPYFVFGESRNQPIQWFDSLRIDWLESDITKTGFTDSAQPGEYFTYQIGIWAFNEPLQDIQVLFSDLKRADGTSIPAGKMTCFNKGGIDKQGVPFTKNVNIPYGRVQALWMGIDLADAQKGTYHGKVYTVSGGKMLCIPIELNVVGDKVSNRGFNEGKRLSRMAWLNTTIGLDKEITRGFQEIIQEENRIKILGRTLTIAPTGLPAEITSYFEPSNQFLVPTGEAVINEPFRFIIEKEIGDIIQLEPGELEFTDRSASHLSWKVVNRSDVCELVCTGRLEYEGYMEYALTLKSKESIRVKDIRLEVHVNRDKAKYMMGLNHEGGSRTPQWKWEWDTTKNQDMLWIGNVNGGLRFKWKAENYVRPLINIYYSFGPLHLPPSWGNKGKGGVSVSDKANDVLVSAYSGSRELKAGDVLNYDFELLITPFKTINKHIQYGDRYFHGGGTRVASRKVELARKAGANILNIHHAEDIYPFINYPYLDDFGGALQELVEDAHAQDIRLKPYYTTRELTKNLPEFWAFYSLNGEVLYPGPGNSSRTEALHPNGPHEWLIENLREKYIPAWVSSITDGQFKGELDLSVLTTPDSRLNNFYIGGLDLMLREFKIDGVYIDDSALDRITLRRARKLIDRYRPEGRMDLHSWNHFNAWAGYTNCLNLYMDLLPYFDVVWIGEGRDYDRMPDHWLIEVSGIPFGLPGQMLQGGGNPWRGMVYGITNRAGYSGKVGDPTKIWNFWDQLQFQDKQMIGYWDPESPVSSDNEQVMATLYKGSDESIIAVANWGDKEQRCSLDLDWEKLGYDKTGCSYSMPGIERFQEEQSISSLNGLKVPGGKGYLIVIRNSN